VVIEVIDSSVTISVFHTYSIRLSYLLATFTVAF
jgi:hypothetical protein